MKRSPEKTYRLRAPSSSSSSNLETPPQGQNRRRQNSNWNGNVQGATNDSNDYKPSIRIVDGFPVQYSCQDNPRQENNIDENDLQEIELTFDYDVVTSQNADVEGSIRSLEWSLLWNVARTLGLHNCNFQNQDPSPDTRRLFTQDIVVSLSSLDFDSIDNSAGTSVGCSIVFLFSRRRSRGEIRMRKRRSSTCVLILCCIRY